MKQYGFGVDIGGTTCKMGLFEASGTLIDSWEITTRTEEKGKFILSDVAEAIGNKLEEKGIEKKEVKGIGIGVPGPVNSEGVVLLCVNLGWGATNVSKILGDLTGLKVKVGNDANVAALGEMWQGGGKGYSDVVMVTLGTGVGGGIIIDGKMVSGSKGAGGEIGHMHMNDEETAVCGCKNKGCLEQYASATGIVRVANKRLAAETTETKLRDIEKLTAKDIYDLAKENDTVALEVVDDVSKYLGDALAHVACVVDPQIIVIGGGVSKAGNIIIETVQKHFKANVFSACRETKFALATLGNDAGMYGCAEMILEV